MTLTNPCFGALGAALLAILIACSQPSGHTVELKHFPMDSMADVLTQDSVEIDREIRSEGSASLRVTAAGTRVVRLFEIRDPSVESTRLTYQARLRTDAVEGRVYLEMWCRLNGQGEYFSRGLQSPLTGTTD